MMTEFFAAARLLPFSLFEVPIHISMSHHSIREVTLAVVLLLLIAHQRRVSANPAFRPSRVNVEVRARHPVHISSWGHPSIHQLVVSHRNPLHPV